jgi:hypothetical protein
MTDAILLVGIGFCFGVIFTHLVYRRVTAKWEHLAKLLADRKNEKPCSRRDCIGASWPVVDGNVHGVSHDRPE